MSYAEYVSKLIICTPAELKGPEKASFLRLMELSNKNEGIHSYLWFKRQLPFNYEDEKLISTFIDRNLIEVIQGRRFRRGGRNYALTTCGLFYILSENQVFSGILLSKYCENIILQLLLFQYMEENTVKYWSPRAAIIISNYLHLCCVASKRTIETVRSLKILKDRDRYLKILELDLKTFAFSLGIRLTRLYSRYMGISRGRGLKQTDQPNHEEDKMLNLLLEDAKFSRFRSNILKELNEAFEELARLKSE
ncbi:MAG: hypothetical protein WBX01_16465 [Nitrososphaeraceae archaeon]|jgi:hypothetical protein